MACSCCKGSCCLNGACLRETEVGCAQIGGVWQGYVDCATAQCDYGACCSKSGGCSYVKASQCHPLLFRGYLTTCASLPVDQVNCAGQPSPCPCIACGSDHPLGASGYCPPGQVCCEGVCEECCGDSDCPEGYYCGGDKTCLPKRVCCYTDRCEVGPPELCNGLLLPVGATCEDDCKGSCYATGGSTCSRVYQAFCPQGSAWDRGGNCLGLYGAYCGERPNAGVTIRAYNSNGFRDNQWRVKLNGTAVLIYGGEDDADVTYSSGLNLPANNIIEVERIGCFNPDPGDLFRVEVTGTNCESFGFNVSAPDNCPESVVVTQSFTCSPSACKMNTNLYPYEGGTAPIDPGWEFMGNETACEEWSILNNNQGSVVDCNAQAFSMQSLPSGPGAELKKMLSWLGIKTSATCSCNKRAEYMDKMGVGWCEQNKAEIVGWLREEAKKRKLPFLDAAGYMLLNLAIKRAKKANRK